jgi:hypothetical protein
MAVLHARRDFARQRLRRCANSREAHELIDTLDESWAAVALEGVRLAWLDAAAEYGVAPRRALRDLEMRLARGVP